MARQMEIEAVRSRLREHYQFVQAEERKPKHQRSVKLPLVKRKVRTMTRWLKELKTQLKKG